MRLVAHNNPYLLTTVTSICFFSTTPSYRYRCNLSAIIRTENDIFTEGVHREGFSDVDVDRIDAFNQQINFLPGSILKQFPNTETMNLNLVELTFISDQSFGLCQQLRNLELERNKITFIPSGTFRNCTNLETLYLGRNDITWIGQNSLIGLENLRYLSLSMNRIVEIPDVWPSRLRGLWLSFNNIDKLVPNSFTGFVNLSSLDMSSNNISAINFNGTTLNNLSTLRLSNNSLYKVERGMFGEMNGLRDLLLDDNPITDIEDKAFIGLPNLSVLQITNNKLNSLNASAFEGADSLVNLEMFNQEMTSIGANTFINVPNLLYLGIGGGYVITLVHRDAFQGLVNLNRLSIVSGLIETLPSGIFRSLTNIADIVLMQNFITRLDSDSFGVLPLLKILRVESNRIGAIQRGFFENFPSLIQFSAPGNRCVNQIFENIDFSTSNAFNQCYENCENV